jgi:hypothetical protein
MTSTISQTQSPMNLWRADVEIPTTGIRRPNKECLGHYESEAAAQQAVAIFQQKISQTCKTTSTPQQNTDTATIIALRMHIKAEQYLRQKQTRSATGTTAAADAGDGTADTTHC